MRGPISAAPLTVTVTPGRTALVLSVTRPSIAPIVALTVCAAARPAIKWPTRSSAPTARRITPPLLHEQNRGDPEAKTCHSRPPGRTDPPELQPGYASAGEDIDS